MTVNSGTFTTRPVEGDQLAICRKDCSDTFENDMYRCRSIEENNALLAEKFPNVPLCCGHDGILDVDKNTCSNNQVWSG